MTEVEAYGPSWERRCSRCTELLPYHSKYCMHYDGRNAFPMEYTENEYNSDVPPYGTAPNEKLPEPPELRTVAICARCINLNMSSAMCIQAQLRITDLVLQQWRIPPGRLAAIAWQFKRESVVWTDPNGHYIGVYADTIFRGDALCQQHWMDVYQEETMTGKR